MKVGKIIIMMAVLLTTGAFAAQSRLSPFTDNLVLHFVGLSGSEFSIDYESDNGVNITGPNPFPDQDASIFIQSNNKYFNGNPALILFYKQGNNGQACSLIFVDGPWSYLQFLDNTPPQCDGLQISNITRTGLYSYQVSIAAA